MKKALFTFSLLLNSYVLPIPMQKSVSYDKTMEIIQVTDSDLDTINQRFFPHQKVTFKKLQASSDLTESGKGSTIFFVYDSNEDPIAIVKKLPLDDEIDKKELVDEVSTLHERHFFHSKHIHVPKLIGTIELTSDERDTGYIIETVAKGSSVNSIVKKAGKAAGQNRKLLLKQLHNCMKESANAFAELHNQKQTSSYIDYYDNYYSDVHSGSFKGPYGIIHGDAHVGNIFYDAKSNQVTFIDLSFMPRSFDGAPVGLDSGKFLFNIEAVGAFYGLTDSEVSSLVGTYKQTYLAKNTKMSEELMDHYTMVAYKDFAFGSEDFLFIHEDQGSFIYRFAKAKVSEHESMQNA